jgi:beta-glucanase (GH16 family)
MMADLNPWPAPFDDPFNLLMNVAVGGNFPGHPNPQTQFPAELVVDYVRVYERAGGYAEAKARAAGFMPYSKEKALPPDPLQPQTHWGRFDVYRRPKLVVQESFR